MWSVLLVLDGTRDLTPRCRDKVRASLPTSLVFVRHPRPPKKSIAGPFPCIQLCRSNVLKAYFREECGVYRWRLTERAIDSLLSGYCSKFKANVQVRLLLRDGLGMDLGIVVHPRSGKRTIVVVRCVVLLLVSSSKFQA
jgi:hypothetical protein